VTLHYEVELALIMGKALQDLEEEDEEQAMSAIEG
jgi:2-keto-4-pentenoate hydratase/2-oxohepta-3-ene-1,7-dioic acid hydratase in catechol pathway